MEARLEQLKEWWAIIAAAIAALFWISRLEWRGIKNEADIRKMQEQRKEDLRTAEKHRKDDLASSQRARDETNHMLDEIRADIKLLLQRGGA